METADFTDCPEDCPRCNRCSHSDPRRQKIEALIRQVELEKEQYVDDGKVEVIPPLAWHERVRKALAV